VIKSLDILKALYEKATKKQETVFYKGIRIKRLMLKSTRKYYEMALSVFIGNQIIKKLESIDEPKSIERIREGLAASNSNISGQWIDLAGMVAPDQAVQELIMKIKSKDINTLEELASGFEHIHNAYDIFVWDWTTRILSERYGLNVNNIDADQLLELISKWETESIKLDKMILNDSTKEFDDSSKIGFGIDGDQAVADKDFNAVRGISEENKFIAGIHKEMIQIEAQAAALRASLEKI
jgi:hypothetical protein